MIDSKTWSETALSSLFSLWNSEANNHHAWRTSEFLNHPQASDGHYFPTATFHSVMAFGDCGVWDRSKPFDEDKKVVQTPDLRIKDVVNFSTYDQVLETLVKQQPKDSAEDENDWVLAVIGSSSHSIKTTDYIPGSAKRNGSQRTIARHQPRQALVIGRLFQALRILSGHAIRERNSLKELLESGTGATNKGQRRKHERRFQFLESLLSKVKDGLPSATDYLCGVVRKNVVTGPVGETGQQLKGGSGIATAAELADSPLFSPFMLLQVAIGLIERDVLMSRFDLKPKRDKRSVINRRSLEKQVQELKSVLTQYFTREVDRMMSRRQIPLYPHYDPASLAFSTHGRTLLDRSFPTESLFRACIEAVIGDQYEDGTWPVGRSATFDDTGTSIQQPSVGVALSLAECIFNRELLVDYRPEKFELVNKGLVALRKTAQYLVNSYSSQCGPSSGWVSDRVRWPNVSETWITAMSARLFHLLWLTERAAARQERLAKYSVRSPGKSHRSSEGLQQGLPELPPEKEELRAKWFTAIVEPDAQAKPAGTLATKVLDPLQQQLEQGTNFVRPPEDGVSFIIFGPPGSGKTFFVETFAKVLEWPLITLNPGHFIRRGLEFIEAEASRIFDDLMHLDHAVILFDECDELFRMRPKEKEEAGVRNILSFATASMLPKLQDLHDARRVIFFLGTNYLANVDNAVRRAGRFDEILFLDRPDDTARRVLIEQVLEKARIKDGSTPSRAKIDSAVNKTRGWMIKDIKSYAKNLLANRPLPDSNIDDYEKWLAEQGDKEIGASRLLKETQDKIRERWSSFTLYADQETLQDLAETPTDGVNSNNYSKL